MTNQEINEKIAAITGFHNTVGLKKRGLWYRHEACGYANCECEAGRFTLEEAKKHEYPHDEPVTIHKFTTPDYFGSLDACQAFERKLTGDERSLYMDHLYLLVIKQNNDAVMGFENQWSMFTASAAYRCHAFLRLKWQWE